MMRRFSLYPLLSLALFFLPSCQPYIPGPSEPLPTYEEEERALEKDDLLPEEPLAFDEFRPEKTAALVYRLKPGNMEKTLAFLEAHPSLRLTAVFPEDFFRDDSNQESAERFKILVSSRQIEAVLTLDKQPNLALIENFSELVPEARNWPFEIKWEEDVMNHLASGIADHKKHWGTLPSGFIPPYFALSPDLVKTLKRFRIAWVLGRPRAESGWRYYGSTGLFIPSPAPEGQTEGSPAWTLNLADFVLNEKTAYLDANDWRGSRSEEAFLQTLVDQAESRKIAFGFVSDLLAAREIKETLSDDSDPFSDDYSDWAQSSRQKQAWGALSEAREVLQQYKNSGRANLRRLDAAQEELLSAESGPFLLALGQSLVTLTSNQQNFIATLSNVYRLCGVAVPEDINRTFSKNKGAGNAPSKPSKHGPFFQREDNSLVWNDPSGDDDGFGNYTYPIGSYKPGVFDLTRFRVSWTETTVRFSAVVKGDIQPDKNPTLPLVDIYIDVNRVTNAGSEASLPQRGSIRVSREAAWEYAASMGVSAGALYQSVIGQKPREIMELKPVHNAQYNSISVSIPRNLLRGEPEQWRISVGLTASEQIRGVQKLTPISVNPSASEKAFGGGIPGRNPPVYIDILARSDDEQKDALGAVVSGREGSLPYVEEE